MSTTRTIEELELPEGLQMQQRPEGLTLIGGKLELTADLREMLPRLRQDRLAHEMLVKAARVKGMAEPKAVDATAGLGDDSLLLAAAGFHVRMFECDPVIASLLRDALERAAADPALAPIVARMELVEGDSIAALNAMAAAGERPDVVLLDPMFPERRKSASVKKKFQLLQQLERPCEDEAALVAAAMAARPRKVVIKRPIKGPELAGIKPSYSINGKAVRYDVIVTPGV